MKAREKEPERRRKAVALRYDAAQDAAPRVVAKGTGLIAERILELAREHDVHVHEDPALVGLLAKLDIDAPIPETLYRAVAEVLAFVYRLNKRLEPPRPPRR
ncbi:MAG: EscU/YscU/HrcU family type III secretion system export apparatus switch protein [Candidatus Hydrogenedentes bacterium]|nr:EscU/YscU/HrcU family type III secretion system export apparatus switch protein [Candidatus Hydrogenedentota bacterium]